MLHPCNVSRVKFASGVGKGRVAVGYKSMPATWLWWQVGDKNKGEENGCVYMILYDDMILLL